MGILGAVLDMFLDLSREHDGVCKVRVSSASTLGKDSHSALLSLLERLLSKKVDLNEEVDDSLLGGVRVFLPNDDVYDNSIRTKLDKLKENFS